MSSLFIYIFLTLFVIFFFCQFWLFKGLFRHWQILRYISDIGNKNRLSKNPCAFHCSVIYLLGGMLRANQGKYCKTKISENKIKVVVRYVIKVCPDEFKEEAIKTLDYVLVDDVINANAIKNNQLENSVKKSGANGKNTHTHKIYAREMAEVLSKYLNEKDRLYLLYLIFTVATADDGKITENEKNALKNIFTMGLNLPTQMLTDMIEAFKKGMLDDWYYSNFGYGNYPTTSNMADLYPHTVTFAYNRKDSYNEPASTPKRMRLFLILEHVLILLICFYFILKGAVVAFIFGIIALPSLLLLIFRKNLWASSFGHILSLPSDIKKCRINLCVLATGFICSATMLWIFLANTFYMNIDSRFYRKIIEKDIYILYFNEVSNNKGGVIFVMRLEENPKTIAEEEPTVKPQLSYFSKCIAETMPHLLIINIYDRIYKDYDFKNVKVNSEVLRYPGNYAHAKLTIGYYGDLVNALYTTFKKDNEKDINAHRIE